METNETSNHPHSSNTPSNSTLMAILAYLGPLVIVSYLTSKDDPFVKFHIKQGLLLLIGDVIAWVLTGSFWQFWMIINILNLAIFIFIIIGIVNVMNKQMKELPLIGHLASNFKF